MARRDLAQIPSVQRNSSRDSISLDATTKHTSHLRSLPRTPPSRAAKSRGRAKAPRARPAVHDTFRSDDARGGVNEHHRIGSDSHDLSWSPRQTQDSSLVDNMLLSLDQLFVPNNQPNGSTIADYSTVEQPDPYSLPRYRFGRQRGHTISSSLSSEHDFPTAENSSHSSNRPSRGHRSNSSGNFQSALRRIDSLHIDDGGKKNIRGRLYETQRAAAPGERSAASRSHGKKGSKSSGSSSLDLGQVLGASRRQPAFERRSSSIDLRTEKRGGTNSGFTGIPRSAFSTSRPQELAYDDLEAAPTPTVPAGPRSRNWSPAKTHFPHSQTLPSASHTLPIPKTPLSRQTWPDRANDSARKGRRGVDMPDANNKQNSPSSRGLNTHSSAHKPTLTSAQGSAAQSKERPGFFKRVFGSASRNVTPPTSSDVSSSQKPFASSKDSVRAESRAGQVSEIVPSARQFSAPSLIDPATPDSKELPQIPLNKKTSFFRRRKKSVSGEAPLPMLPSELQNQSYGPPTMIGVDASPVSSLRKVMDPYLHSPVPPPYHRDQLLDDHAGQHDIAYLAGYAARNESSKRPDPFRSIHLENIAATPRKLSLPMRDNPKPRNHTNDDSHHILGDTFLHDSSGNEGKIDVDKNSDMFSATRDVEDHGETRLSESSSRKEHIEPTEGKESPRSKPISSKGNPKNSAEFIAMQSVPYPIRGSNTEGSKQEAHTPKKVNLKDWNTPRSSPKADKSPSKPSSQHSARIWLAPTDSEENITNPIGGYLQLEASQSSAPILENKMGSSCLTALKQPSSVANLAGEENASSESHNNEPMTDEILTLETELSNETNFIGVDLPTDEDRVQARKIFDGEDTQIDKSKAVPWLGEPIPERARIRRAYMELFDWRNLDILASLRGLCSRILLKGETQQVDRIIQSFSNRWCQCNQNHGFKATGMSHVWEY